MRRGTALILAGALAFAASLGAATPIDIPIIINGPAPAPGTLQLSLSPASATVASSIASGGAVSTITAVNTGGSAPVVGFGAPYFDDGGLFAISGNHLIINPAGQGVSALASSTQPATIIATAGSQTISQNFALAVSPVATQVNFTNVVPQIQDNSGAGTFMATIVVTMSDGTTDYHIGLFTTSDTNHYAISGSNIVTARQLTPADDGIHPTVITAIGGFFLSAAPAGGTTSTAPSGPSLTTGSGIWTWGGAASGRPGEYHVNLNGNPVGVGTLMEVATANGQLYVDTAALIWYVWQN